ncbi:MAG: DUF5060 domain-containing protein [Akkermansiaceae bacterium]|nr:DUF5060 domain-containing protein [Armatimonadota bacterium]
MKQQPLRRRNLIATLLLSAAAIGCSSVAWGRPGTDSKIAMRFELSDLTGNPFDFFENDVQVDLSGPGNRTMTVPAFFDGGKMWGVRCTPPTSGKWRVTRVLRNGQTVTAQNIAPMEFTVTGKPTAGFIRRDAKDPRFFAYENGTPYYPIGCNAAWNSGKVSVEAFLEDMGKSGQNWSRIWMNHWDGKNLDWVQNQKVPPGELSLVVAKRWDGIVEIAERAGVPFQMVFQHHGQYSEQVNPNWGENPWNVKNGGFLATPEEFFTNEKARRLTQAKYRYILARWGYSPSIVAWELYNEVQFTNTGRNKDHATIAAWHKEMAAFLRKHDVHKHMVTTSSDESITGLYDAMDYIQPHSYPSDLVATVRAVGDQFVKSAGENGSKKPVFLGEIGPSGDLAEDDGTGLRQIVWGSLMTAAPGAAQYWTWDNITNRNLTGAWKPATDFVRVFRLAGRRAMRPVSMTFTGDVQGAGATSFGPGGGWEGAKQTRYTVEPSGEVAGAGALSPYLQGDNNRALLPFVEFAVNYAKPGTFTANVRQISKGGANVVMKVDGKVVTEKSFPAAASETNVRVALTGTVPAGAHVVRLENTGVDWARIEKLTLSPYGAPLKAVAKSDKESVAAWVYPSEPLVADAKPLTSTVSVPGLDAGKYRVFWWDTATGKTVTTETVSVASGQPLTVKTPPIRTNIALFAAHERTGKYTL